VTNPNDEIQKLIRNPVPLGSQDLAHGHPAQGGGLLQIYTILSKLRQWVARVAANASSGGLGGNVLARPTLYPGSPVMDFSPDRSYYPTLLYFPSGYTPPPPDTGSFKYVCICQNYSGSTGLDIRASNNFVAWTRLAAVTGVIGLTNPAHPFILRTPGEAKAYRIYYWDTSQLYSVASIRTADSDDLVTWTNDTPLANGAPPFITGVSPNWNRGSYGPASVFYNPAATNTGSNPFDYSYALFFDATTGGVQSIGLAYSADGVTFNLYSEVFKYNTAGWDTSHVATARFIQIPAGDWLMFYSGGSGSANQGVGLARSSDRINWERLTYAAPLIGLDPLTWRGERAYATAVLADFDNAFAGAGDEAVIKLLLSGRSSGGNYTMGYAYCRTLYTNDANNAVIPTTT